jgi:hypothetical protein
MKIVQKFFIVNGVRHSVWCPDWARWIAMDEDEDVWVFDSKPDARYVYWMNSFHGRRCQVITDPYHQGWCNSLRRLR